MRHRPAVVSKSIKMAAGEGDDKVEANTDQNRTRSLSTSSHDANNNRRSPMIRESTAETALRGGMPAQLSSPRRAQQKGGSQHSESLSSDQSDDWHLLEVDDNYSASSSSSNNRDDNRSPKLKPPTRASSHKNHHDEDKESVRETPVVASLSIASESTVARKMVVKQRAVSVGLNSPQSAGKHSPILVFVCTALYSLIPLASLLAVLTLIVLALTRYWPVTALYLTYLFLDRKTCNYGGRRLDFFYKSSFYSHLAAYFPIRMRFSENFKLNPQENYILNYHPHGISAFGCVCAFGTDALNFAQLFPGITARFMVHETLFHVPIMREIFSLRGDCSVNSKSFDYMLTRERRGNLLALVGGGLAEADLSDAERLKVVVATRKGFVKKALMHGAHLIPCIAFGENSVFTKVNFEPSSFMHKLETRWYDLFKFKHPIYYGTSIFSSKRNGSMPYKRPITVVMGNPILIKKCETPSQTEVDKLHSEYLVQLKKLYEANSDLCIQYDTTMELV